ncbi:MAG: helix-turn-helix domain-containing protein [Enterococcus aquimarinus]|uniref:Helix-turn-helix domain-containing protein n=1 Tax=Enterococcus aquimarinus TaxID=328396 RepID=A0A9E3ZWH9_9ENTE|nr:helix-turn-helix domain-containing protein [Enterococcus aquimarinus]
MSLLTIVEASKQFKVGRTTIYKAIKRGDLTPQKNHDGVQVIDAQDMIRVFGSSKKSVSPPISENSTQPVSGNSGNNEDLLRELREQVKELKQDKEFLKQEISSVRKDFDDYKLMITYKGNLSSVETVETVETVPETSRNSFEEQEKQPKEQVETTIDEPKIEEKKGFFKRLFGA